MSTLTCDVAIIGAGTAGIAAELSARQAGATTLLIDERFAGTTCASVGCMPSKLLIAAANAAHAVRRAVLFGIHTDRAGVDGAAVMRRVRMERDRFVAGAKDSLAKIPDNSRIRARAHFVDATTLALDDGRMVRARTVVIASGSRSIIPTIFEPVKHLILTNETIFELLDLPKSVAVVGAGPLGLELAQALSRLGVEIRVFDEAPHLSGITDIAVEQDFRSIISTELPVTLGVTLQAKSADGGVRVTWSGDSEGTQTFERLLMAAGRPPALSDLNLQATGIGLDELGTPAYDPATMQCSGSSIFIAGDADHSRPVLHEAAQEGVIAGRNAAGYPNVLRARRYVPLSIMFTDPQVAIVGHVPPSNAVGLAIGCASYVDQGRAKVFARNSGLVHLYADATDGRLRGATLVGPEVEHSAHLIALAIQQGMAAGDVLQMPIYHPTYEEGLKPALRSICSAVHAPSDDVLIFGD